MIEPGAAPRGTGPEGSDLLAPPETTGRFVVVFAESCEAPSDFLRDTAGLHEVATARDLRGEDVQAETAQSTDAVFDEIGMAVVTADPDQLGALQQSAQGRGDVLAVSPELVHHVLVDEYLRGYVDGVDDLSRRLGLPAERGAGGLREAVQPMFSDTADATWGLQATRADVSTLSGQGISVAVLDTGFDVGHPDFARRSVTMQSFVPNQGPQDGHGHGTHCIGTACGPADPDTGPRYGVAHGAKIHVAKVLSDTGAGTDGGILAGIDWAVGSGCTVVSMSFGADVPRAHPPYTVAGRRALDRGCLLVAAAGNNASRASGDHGFVGAPANSPYVVAVAALTHSLDVADFSARSLADVMGGQVDVAAPGLQIYSSWPMPTGHRTISGTSMATPHVAGLAALWAEATGFRGRELWSVLTQESRRLQAPSMDVGTGMVLAP